MASLASTGLRLGTLVLLAVAVTQPLWVVTTAVGGGSASASYFRDRREIQSALGPSSTFTHVDYYSNGNFDQPGMASVITATAALALAALVVSIVGLAVGALALRSRALAPWATVLDILAVLLPLGASLYFLLQFPPVAASETRSTITSLWGSRSNGVTTTSWAAGLAWYLITAGAATALVALLAHLGRRPMPAGEGPATRP